MNAIEALRAWVKAHDGVPEGGILTNSAVDLVRIARGIPYELDVHKVDAQALEDQGNTILDQRRRIEALERAAGDAAIRERELREAVRVEGDSVGSLTKRTEEDAAVRKDLLDRLDAVTVQRNEAHNVQKQLADKLVEVESDLKVVREDRSGLGEKVEALQAELRKALIGAGQLRYYDRLKKLEREVADLQDDKLRLQTKLDELQAAPIITTKIDVEPMISGLAQVRKMLDPVELRAEVSRLKGRVAELRGAIYKVDKELHEGLNKGWVDVLKIIRPILLRALDPARPRLAGQEELLNPTFPASGWRVEKPDLRAQVERTIERIKATGGLEPQDRPRNNVEFLAMRLFNAEKERDELKAELVRMWGVDTAKEIPRLMRLSEDLGKLNVQQRARIAFLEGEVENEKRARIFHSKMGDKAAAERDALKVDVEGLRGNHAVDAGQIADLKGRLRDRDIRIEGLEDGLRRLLYPERGE